MNCNPASLTWRIFFAGALCITHPARAEHPKRECFITQSKEAILATCARDHDSFAIHLKQDGNIYFGEWAAGRPAGDGVFFEVVRDTESRFCGLRKIIPQIRGVRVTDWDQFHRDYDDITGCPGRHPLVKCPANGRQARFPESGGDFVLGTFSNARLEGLAARESLWIGHGRVIGFFRHDQQEGEGISMDNATITHGLWKKGILVTTFQLIDLSNYQVKVSCPEPKQN